MVELVVVVAVAVLVVGALAFATLMSLRNAQFAKNQAQATKLAQEGMERVRTGRDRDRPIAGFRNDMDSWDDDAFWNNQISDTCPANCYFNVNTAGWLTFLASSLSLPSLAEEVGSFKRAVVLADELSTYQNEKNVTVIVQWTDFAGPHESRLTTILRRL